MEKPQSREHAREMICSMRGREHNVHTGVALINIGNCCEEEDGEHATRILCERQFFCTTKVHFCDGESLTNDVIDDYISTDEPYDKAGGYGIQGIAGCFVKGIEGCYYNVMGLPLSRLAIEIGKL